MRKVATLLLCCILLAGALVLPVSAESTASKVDTIVTVTADGDCIVSSTVRLSLDSPMENLTYPVPLNATDISLNGGMARTSKTTTATEVDVSRAIGGMAGEVTVALNYNIPGAVKVSNHVFNLLVRSFRLQRCFLWIVGNRSAGRK